MSDTQSKIPILTKRVTFLLGLHMVIVNLIREGDNFKVWNIVQEQKVGANWTSSGCHWYSREQLNLFGGRASVLVNVSHSTSTKNVVVETHKGYIDEINGEQFLFFEED